MSSHLFTVDVEEYFQVAALQRWAPRSEWQKFPHRVDVGVDRLLELLARHEAGGTFFILGSVAEWNPTVVRRIAAAGHEVASHGWSHRPVNSLSRADFLDELQRSRQLLSELSGQPVRGFRAPNFSIRRTCEWAFDALLEAGYSYDSSIFPQRPSGRDFGVSEVQLLRRPGGDLMEIPMSTAGYGGLKLPAAGGAWLRLLPYPFTARALKQAEHRGTPGVLYIHPWELDPEQPRLSVTLATRVRHYWGINRVADRLDRLLADFRFVSVKQWLTERGQAARSTSEQAQNSHNRAQRE